ncbi:ubiquitin-like-specific protease 1C [Daucus carota subsp. sativus]|uniref:ubiquitin-like-specific protease 1C n=1 Tax=Daucus carota subsp. sativus TaxID=79200 RepID=UPI003082BCA3
MLIPIFEEKHWSLVIICFLAEEEGVSPMLLHLDSYEYHQATKISEPIKWFLKQKWNNLKGESSDFPTVDTKTVEVPQQTNDYDCGLFVMYFMKLFLKQAPKRFKIQNLEMTEINLSKLLKQSAQASKIYASPT